MNSGPNFDTQADNATGINALREQLDALRRTYRVKLPAKIALLQEARKALSGRSGGEANGVEKLQQQVHNLAGSGATYGFPQLSRVARDLEIFLKPFTEQTLSFDAASLARIDEYLAGIVRTIEEAAQDGAPEAVSASNSHASHGDFLQSPPPQVPWSTNSKRLVYAIGADSGSLNDFAVQIGHFGYKVRKFQDLEKLREAIASDAPSAIVADAETQDAFNKLQPLLTGKNGSESRYPPVIFTSERSDMQARLQAVRAGGDAYFTKPLDIGELIDQLDAFTAHDSPSPYRILIIDDEESLTSFFSLTLQGAGMTTAAVNDPLEIMQALFDFRPDLILMDVYMPACTGLELAAVIRQQEDYVSIPIVFLSAETDIDKQLAAMSSGGDDFLTKPIQPDHLISSVAARAQRSRTLRSFMIRDSLTGLLNHTTTKEQLSVEMLRAKRAGTNLSFAMIDIDKFKSINDTHGHLVGDRVIKSLSRLLTQRLRKTDIIGRYGGEEFAAILVDTDVKIAMKVLEEIREGFSKVHHYSPKGEFCVTLSAGLAQYPGYDDVSHLNDAADKALYEAKHSGRNRIVTAP